MHVQLMHKHSTSSLYLHKSNHLHLKMWNALFWLPGHQLELESPDRETLRCAIVPSQHDHNPYYSSRWHNCACKKTFFPWKWRRNNILDLL